MVKLRCPVTINHIRSERSCIYMIPYKQLSLADIFTDCQNKFDNDKYEFLSILDETINLDEIWRNCISRRYYSRKVCGVFAINITPTLSKDDVVIMDNMRSHHAEQVEEVLDNTHISFLPPYSPDLNPIEKCGSKSKLFSEK